MVTLPSDPSPKNLARATEATNELGAMPTDVLPSALNMGRSAATILDGDPVKTRALELVPPVTLSSPAELDVATTAPNEPDVALSVVRLAVVALVVVSLHVVDEKDEEVKEPMVDDVGPVTLPPTVTFPVAFNVLNGFTSDPVSMPPVKLVAFKVGTIKLSMAADVKFPLSEFKLEVNPVPVTVFVTELSVSVVMLLATTLVAERSLVWTFVAVMVVSVGSAAAPNFFFGPTLGVDNSRLEPPDTTMFKAWMVSVLMVTESVVVVLRLTTSRFSALTVTMLVIWLT